MAKKNKTGNLTQVKSQTPKKIKKPLPLPDTKAQGGDIVLSPKGDAKIEELP